MYGESASGSSLDAETNLHYNYFRDYDPATGRYVQSDPIGLKGGISTYGYVGGNPLSFTDSMGLIWKCTTNGLFVSCANTPDVPIDPIDPPPPPPGGIILPPDGGFPNGIQYPYTPDPSIARIGVLPLKPPIPPKGDCDTALNQCTSVVKATCVTVTQKVLGYAGCIAGYLICKKVIGGGNEH